MSENWATGAGTAQYFQSRSMPLSKIKHFDSLSVSALGAGTYLGSVDDADDNHYEKTLLKAGLEGINFFDTAINYRCQRSERVLGAVIRKLEERGIERNQLVIATKGGFLPVEGPADQYDDYVRIHYIDTGIIEEKEIVAGCHCMSPAFLDNQIDSSLKNLSLDCIDLYYLHNPETQFAEIGEEEFYKRLLHAFILFESKVREKKIVRYGLATWNGFRQKADQKGTLQLAKVIECAIEAGGKGHHFKAIQLPFNLVMLEAIKNQNQIFDREKKTVAVAAAENGIALMVSAPLMQSQLGSLCKRVFQDLPQAPTQMVQCLEFVLSTPEVCTAFCGMRREDHWDENRKVLAEAAWTPELWHAACKSIGL